MNLMVYLFQRRPTTESLVVLIRSGVLPLVVIVVWLTAGKPATSVGGVVVLTTVEVSHRGMGRWILNSVSVVLMA